MKYLLIACLFLFSCSKTAEMIQTPEKQQTTHTFLESTYLVKDLGSTLLKITLEPVLSCYGYVPGQTPRPCDIMIEVTCTLSKPISGAIKVELSRMFKADIQSPNGQTETVIQLNIAPNTKEVIFSSRMTSNSTELRDIFRIKDARIYYMVN